MDPVWLEDFMALAEQKSFSRAADIRNVSQPAFSRRIRALEDWVGAPLFVRGGQGAILTAAGNHFRPLADDMVKNLTRARRETKAISERETASLSIAATHALSFTFFPTWIRTCLSLDDVGSLTLISDSMAGCEQVMLGGEVHFLLCHHHADARLRLEHERFRRLTVGSDVLVPVCAPGTNRRPLWSLSSAPRRPTRLLAYHDASGLGRIVAARGVLNGKGMVLETVFTSHLAATLLAMAREGHGVAWLPKTLIADDLARGELVSAGAGRDIEVEICLFRALDCRNRSADRFWTALGGT